MRRRAALPGRAGRLAVVFLGRCRYVLRPGAIPGHQTTFGTSPATLGVSRMRCGALRIRSNGFYRHAVVNF